MAFVKKNKKNKITDPFVPLFHHVVRHQKYYKLNAHSKALLIDIYDQYNGKNNGDFTVAFKVMKEKGWKSSSMLFKCIKELIDNGFIELTRQGDKHKCNLYGVCWLPIDECKGKLDIRPTITPSNNFKNN